MNNGKWLLVLGANSDIAVATTELFAQNGWNLLLASRNTENLKNVAGDMRLRYGIEVKTDFYDALLPEAPDKISELIKSNSIDVVLLAFGYIGNQKTAESDEEELRKIAETNYIAAVSALEPVASCFLKKGSGCIIGISSVAGERGRQSNYHYGASKAAFSAYLSGLRQRLYPHNIHVMTVKPGFTNTKMTSHLSFPTILTASPEKVASDIYKGYLKKKNVVYSKKIWAIVMVIVRFIPEFLFKRLKL